MNPVLPVSILIVGASSIGTGAGLLAGSMNPVVGSEQLGEGVVLANFSLQMLQSGWVKERNRERWLQ
ncbi:MAG: hypothetical protein EPO10_07250 [Reyranella sp.]|uniref:hypothetical protein n=1 Tax=Reyranella sp. TaxID=1929291 RepID=UPI00122AB8DF|nr:hypothetical protein [Reyranella sp.]TAJ92122.1 MAG: hypothetical protein EPO41_14530 [Reyranella sp.]TBR29567.1 MAG: hypothetical protein EPO10_07250 [Reyranella sp.]